MIDLKKNEETILEYWFKNNINEKIREINKSKKKKFFFLDGPPYASGELAGHHIWVGSTKDIVLRYRRYLGDVYDRAGFDVHGLPIEHSVEKQMNLNSKMEIETKIGINKFIDECKKYAKHQVELGVKTFKRFGISLDFENLYLPYKNEYIEKAWTIFKAIAEKNLLYKDLEPLAYCTHCETVLSAQGPEVEYSDETDPSILVKFKIKKTNIKLNSLENTYLVIWTTTPWTLVANMAIAVKSDAEYVLIGSENENYIIAKSRIDEFVKLTNKNIIIKSNFYGSELKNTVYMNPLGNIDEIEKKFYKVIADPDFASLNEGTGLVHVAPGHGPEDYKLSKKYKIPLFSPVDEHGKYTLKDYIEIKVPNEANKIILSKLKQADALLFLGNIMHSYPHCWRCNTKLIYRATEQWFINVQKLKTKMLRENKKIEWIPDVANTWFYEAIKTSPDLCISRQRYWGIPIPIWKCDSCDEIKIIGSKHEMLENAIIKKDINDLHRPYVDEIEIRCQKCNSEMKRIKDVFDVWYDSGIAHTASLTDKEFEKYFPADWISESADQIRGWFSVLLKTSTALYNKAPYKKVSIGGMIKDELGREMHRHLGNTVSGNELLEFTSADGFRFWCLSHPRWIELKLKKQDIDEADRKIIILYNISELVKEFNLILNNGQKEKIKYKIPKLKNLEKEDIWIISRLNSLIGKVTQNMNEYKMHDAVRELKEFIVEDFSRFYLKFAKQRATESKKEMKLILNICSYVIYNMLILSSIAIPFSCEFIYQDLFSNKESIFMNKWPKQNKKIINHELENQFELLKDISKAILSLREKEQIKLKWPLQEATIELNNDQTIENVYKISNLIENYANVKSIKIIKSETNKKIIKPIFNKLGPEFKQNAQIIANQLINQDASVVEQDVEKQGYYLLNTGEGNFEIKKDQFVVIEKALEDESALQFKYGSIKINKNISKELKEEILIRELIRNIQIIRKEINLMKINKINIYIKTEKDVEEIIKRDAENIKQKTNTKQILFEIDEKILEKELQILDYNIKIKIEKIN